MIELRKGTVADKADIIDFINCVFSQDKFPHDFKKMVPKCYADSVEGLGAEHYMVVDEGKIKALVAMRLVEMNTCGKRIKAGLIGNVAVHYYSRGEGYMKKLMNWTIEDAKAMGVDLLVLNGFRQRYGYFGFEQAGYKISFTVNTTNLRHTMSEVDDSLISFKELTENMKGEIDFAHSLMQKRVAYITRKKEEFVEICHSWHQIPRIIYSDNSPIGYLVSVENVYSEIVLQDEKDFSRVIKAIFAEDGLKETVISVAPYEVERVDLLSEICEKYEIEHVEMLNVLNWKNTLEALLTLKNVAEQLCDGEISLAIEGKGYKIKASNGSVTVSETDEIADPKLSFTNSEAEKAFFAPIGLVRKLSELKNWAPLPFFINAADAF